jgi:PiT family inorganic phosphate transporter
MVLLYILFGLALIFSFFNGFHDSSNIVATIISSRALPARWALVLTAIAEFSGAVIFGLGVAAVARTIGTGLIPSNTITVVTLIAALGGAILWSIITWLFGIPSSSSHSLIGGLIGAAWVQSGLGVIEISSLVKILLILFISPLIGLAVGYLFTKLVFFLSKSASMRINQFFKNIQIFTGMALAFSHGANDPQKTMGIIALGLLIAGVAKTFELPVYVVLTVAAACAIGTATGGWRLIKTIGAKFYKIRPVHGFCTQVSSALVIFGAAILGGPVSTTQVISSAVLGAGSAQRINMVRWGVAGQMLIAWFLTIPVTGLISASILWVLKSIALG